MRTIQDYLKEALSQKTCMKHPVAVVIETIENKHMQKQYVLGWNGAPMYGVPHTECSRKGYASGQGMHLCPTVHAERRAISRAAKLGIDTFGAKIYMNEWFPCVDCAKSIIEAGIAVIVTPDELYEDKEKHILIPKLIGQSYNFEMSEQLIREAGLEIIVDPSIRLQ